MTAPFLSMTLTSVSPFAVGRSAFMSASAQFPPGAAATA
jgi:hypothetical protein